DSRVVRVAASGRISLRELSIVLGPSAVADGHLPMQVGLLRMGPGHSFQHLRGPLMGLRGGHHRLTRVPLDAVPDRHGVVLVPPPGVARLHPIRTIFAAHTGHARVRRSPTPARTSNYVPTTPSIQPRGPTLPTTPRPPGKPQNRRGRGHRSWRLPARPGGTGNGLQHAARGETGRGGDQRVQADRAPAARQPRPRPRQPALKGDYLAVMSLDPTGTGRKRWIARWKAALNA